MGVQSVKQSRDIERRRKGLGFKIKEKREQLKMTQEELSQKSGVCRTTISQLENGTARTTTTRTLMAIAKALNTTVENIFFTDGV